MNRLRLGLASLMLVLGALAAGCGGGSDSTTTATTQGAGTTTQPLGAEADGSGTFRLVAVQKCLKASGLTAERFENTLINGSGGELKVTFGDPRLDWIFIAFGKDFDEAKAIHDKAVDVAVEREHLPRDMVLAGVQQNGNVFYYSDAGPLTEVDRQKVEACLH